MAVSTDFLSAAAISSVDWKLLLVSTINAANAATTPMTKAIPRQVAAVMFCVGGPVAVSLEGNAIAANPTEGAISLQTGWSNLIPLENDVDVIPQVFNGGAGAVAVSMLVFTKRRKLERQRGMV